ncbi:MAG: rhodanese-like domain-containing protein [Bryobacteraceae bacterium]|nr:rhodanese-like domain-containing protein [Bryobacteraceae bacterium]
MLTRRAALLLAAATGVRANADAIPAKARITPAEAVSLLPQKPMVICVAFPFLYRSAHIEGAVYGGAGSKPEGLETLAALVKDVPKNRDIVLYCGCCPWDHCPNMEPAFNKLASLGYTRVKAMVIPTNLHTDWITKGYPTKKA